MALNKPLFLEAVTGDTAISYTGQDFRGLTSALAPNAGTIAVGDLAVSQRSAGANMSVDVAAGRAMVVGTSVANQGTYLVQNTASYNVAIPTANATNPRIDLIVARVYDKQAAGGTRYDWAPEVVQGTAAASPTVPATPASSLVLAQVAVAANATSITTGNITERRVLSGVGDVPKWDLYGTATPTPQSVGSTATAVYVPRVVSQAVGVVQSTGTITCRTPGRYAVHFGNRMSSSSADCHRINIIHVANSSGTILRRISNTLKTASNVPLSVAGTVYLNAGDTVTAFMYQDSSGSLSVDDSFLETGFTGVWVGS